jgi:hypothetical protein
MFGITSSGLAALLDKLPNRHLDALSKFVPLK